MQALRHAARGVDAREREPRGRLRISAPVNFGNAVLSPMICAIAQRYPRLDIQVELNDLYGACIVAGAEQVVPGTTAKLRDRPRPRDPAGDEDGDVLADRLDLREVVTSLHAEGHVDAKRMKLTMSGFAIAAAMRECKLRDPRRYAERPSQMNVA